MHLVSFSSADRASWGTISGQRVRDHGATTAAAGRSLGDVLRAGDLTRCLTGPAPELDLAKVLVGPPVVDPRKIICIGLNYADHIREMKRPWPAKPVVFTRYPDSLVGPDQPLIAPRNSAAFDYEGELAVVIGAAARHVSPQEAMNHVLGYSLVNDGSLRDYQRHTHQFTPGKNFPASGSFGPAVVTADEFGDPTGRRITTTLNGEVVQRSTLDELVFGVAELIAYCSEWTTLLPGDVIATGTPGGVADGGENPRWLVPGDVVEVEVEGVGTLRNPVVTEP